MPQRSAICIVIDRLHVGMLGAYGNSWIHTPAFDQLGSDGLVLDQAIIDSPALPQLQRAYWCGQHAGSTDLQRSLESVLGLLSAAGLQTVLVTDEPELISSPSSSSFIEQLLVERHAAHEAETEMERLFGRAAAWLDQQKRPFFCWIHSRGLSGAWDAPLELRNQYADEEDPVPPNLRVPPQRRIAPNDDPDELLGIVHAYAGQVSHLDSCLGVFLELVAQHPVARDALMLVLSARGFPLGEHGRIGAIDDALYSELVQVPLFARLPDRTGALLRSGYLVQPADIFATLLDWHQLDFPSPIGLCSLLQLARGDALPAREAVFSMNGQELAMRTVAWHARRCQPAEQTQLELFVKPDDRWEANDISTRCPEAAEAATQLLEGVGNSFDASNPPLIEPVLTTHVGDE